MISAKYVNVQGDRLVAIYGPDVEPRALHDVARQLAALPGVQARAARGIHPVAGESTATTVLWMRVLPGYSADRPQKRFRQLTQPELPITIIRLNVYLGACRCGKTSITVNEAIFLPEFDPEDVELFDLRLYAALQRLEAWSLVNEQPVPPYKPLTDALDKLLAELGAYATDLYVEPHYDPKLPCTHIGAEGR